MYLIKQLFKSFCEEAVATISHNHCDQFLTGLSQHILFKKSHLSNSQDFMQGESSQAEIHQKQIHSVFTE